MKLSQTTKQLANFSLGIYDLLIMLVFHSLVISTIGFRLDIPLIIAEFMPYHIVIEYFTLSYTLFMLYGNFPLIILFGFRLFFKYSCCMLDELSNVDFNEIRNDDRIKKLTDILYNLIDELNEYDENENKQENKENNEKQKDKKEENKKNENKQENKQVQEDKNENKDNQEEDKNENQEQQEQQNKQIQEQQEQEQEQQEREPINPLLSEYYRLSKTTPKICHSNNAGIDILNKNYRSSKTTSNNNNDDINPDLDILKKNYNDRMNSVAHFNNFDYKFNDFNKIKVNTVSDEIDNPDLSKKVIDNNIVVHDMLYYKTPFDNYDLYNSNSCKMNTNQQFLLSNGFYSKHEEQQEQQNEINQEQQEQQNEINQEQQEQQNEINQEQQEQQNEINQEQQEE